MKIQGQLSKIVILKAIERYEDHINSTQELREGYDFFIDEETKREIEIFKEELKR